MTFLDISMFGLILSFFKNQIAQTTGGDIFTMSVGCLMAYFT